MHFLKGCIHPIKDDQTIIKIPAFRNIQDVFRSIIIDLFNNNWSFYVRIFFYNDWKCKNNLNSPKAFLHQTRTSREIQSTHFWISACVTVIVSVLTDLYSTTNDNQPQCHVLTESWNVQLWFRLKYALNVVKWRAQLVLSILRKKRRQAVHMAINNTHTLWLINPQFKTTADCVYAEANQTVQHASCWENASYDATEPHEELPQGHVLLSHLHHQRADVILHKDPRNPMTPRCVVYHSLPLGDWILVCVRWHLVRLQFCGHNGNEVLEHMIMICGHFFRAIQRI